MRAPPPNKRLKLTGHRALQISVLPFGHETRRFQRPGHLGRQLSREPLGRMKTPRDSRNIVAALAAFGVLLVAILWWAHPLLPSRPDLQAVPSDSGVRIQALFLGEYTYPVERLEIRSLAKGDIVLRILPTEHATFEFHSADLVLGANPAQLSTHDTGRVIVPSTSTFHLTPSSEYSVRLQVRSLFPWAREARVGFRMPPAPVVP